MQTDEKFLDAMLGDEKFRELFSGRGVIGDYIEVRERNNRVRETAVAVLLSAVHAVAAEAESAGVALSVERFDECRFDMRSMKLSGPALRIRHGVRCLTVETGWTRLPSDGVMREGALAAARLSHFGMPEHTAEIYLLVFDDRPRWFSVGRDGIRVSFEAEDLVGHFGRLVGDK